MKINLLGYRCDDKLTVERTGDRLRINGELFNFNPVSEGATINARDIPCKWIVGDVTRTNGEIELTLLLPVGPNPSQAVAFPEPITDVPEGIVTLPFDPEPEPPVMPTVPDEEPANVDA